MLSRDQIRRNKTLAVDRAAGALLGHAIGDSFGDAARTPENHFQFGITMDFREGPAPGTDDTEFALLTARTLIDSGGKLTDESVVAAWRRDVLPLRELHRGGASERERARILQVRRARSKAATTARSPAARRPSRSGAAARERRLIGRRQRLPADRRGQVVP